MLTLTSSRWCSRTSESLAYDANVSNLGIRVLRRVIAMDSFSDVTRNRLEPWTDFAMAAWRSAGAPPELAPEMVYNDPLAYSFNAYHRHENAYRSEFTKSLEIVVQKLTSTTLVEREFSSVWAESFDSWSLWKQLRPFFVFAAALGVDARQVARPAAVYIIGQGVPSNAVDKLLDTSNSYSFGRIERIAPFCMIANSLALPILYDFEGPDAQRIEKIYLHYAGTMYSMMWREFAARYKVPSRVRREDLEKYVTGESRILSSVFYGIGIEWAHVLGGAHINTQVREACDALRRVRQLNDELIDTQDDFWNGILTYPVLHALASSDHSAEVGELLLHVWRAPSDGVDGMDALSHRFHSLLLEAGSFEATAHRAIDQLLTAANFVMDSFEPSLAFDISLILNQRISTLIKRAHVNWGYVADLYQPQHRGEGMMANGRRGTA